MRSLGSLLRGPMTDAKRHHYLPEFYLEGFANRGKLWAHDREQGKYREQTPHNTAVLSHYYSYQDEEGVRSTDLEAVLALVESEAKPVIEKLATRTPISAAERGALSLFLSLLRMRVPDFEKEVGELIDTVYKEVNRIIFATKESTEAVLNSIAEETGEELHVVPEDLMKLAADKNYEVTMPRAGSLGLTFSLAEDLAKVLYDLDWVVTIAPPGTHYLTTDNPFTIVPPPPHLRIPHRGVGIVTPGAEKYVPLSSTTLLGMLGPGRGLGFIQLPPPYVEIANNNNASNCDRFVIGPDERTIRSAVRATGVDTSSRRPKWVAR